MFVSVYLLKKTYKRDSIGNSVVDELTKTKIPATKRSISREEMMEYGKLGHTPSFMLETNKANYRGESEVEFAGHRYLIYRTYAATNKANIELYCRLISGEKYG